MGLLDPVFNVSNNQASLEAINDYFLSTAIKTDAARKIKADFLAWYQREITDSFLGQYSRANVEEAYNRRNSFNLANEIHDQKALEWTRHVQTTGMKEQDVLDADLGGTKSDVVGNYPTRPGITALSAADGTILPGARPTIRYGSSGKSVEAWQKILGIPADGKFGPQTRSVTKSFQAKHGLIVDGVVGPATWGAALSTTSNMHIEEAAVTYVTPVGTPTSRAKTGEIIPIQNIKQPSAVVSRITRKSPTVAKAASTKAQQIKTAGVGEFSETFNNLPWWGKAGVLAGGGTAIYYLTKDFGKPSKKRI